MGRVGGAAGRWIDGDGAAKVGVGGWCLCDCDSDGPDQDGTGGLFGFGETAALFDECGFPPPPPLLYVQSAAACYRDGPVLAK